MCTPSHWSRSNAYVVVIELFTSFIFFSLETCRYALDIAQTQFGIPSVLSAEDLSSPDLDELSCLTYLSYFLRKDGAGYRATLERVNRLIPEARVDDFQQAWNDGYALCHLVNTVGGHITNLSQMRYSAEYWMQNCSVGMCV